MTADQHDAQQKLADRIRAVLGASTELREVREVNMFGGLSFMVDGALAVAARRDGSLLVRVDPDRYDDHLAAGASPAMMRGDRPMGRGWMSVDAAHLDAQADLLRWVKVGVAGRATQA
jgi:TfoX/Sxy family transcriptional regulator of competence genes